MIIGYGWFAFLVFMGILFPNLEWDDPQRMTNQKTSLPSLNGSLIYRLVGIVIAWIVFLTAHADQDLAIPIVIIGLALLAGGTWFFVNWNSNRVEKAWPGIGIE